MAKTTMARVKALDELIRGRKYPNRKSFATAWEVCEKTVQRDIDFIREQLGAPIEFDRERNGYYYTDETWFLPSVALTEGELFSLLIARQAIEQYRGTPLAADLDRIYAKIAGSMNDIIAHDASLLSPLVSFAAPPAMPVNEAVWNAVLRGARDRRAVRIRYAKPHADPIRREIHPLAIVNLQGEWYVLASSSKSTEVKQYAMGRIEEGRVTRVPFARPQDFDARRWLDQSFGRFASPADMQEVRIRFDAEIEPWIIQRTWHRQQRFSRNAGDGSIELTFPASASGPRPFLSIISWVLSFGSHATVLAPQSLRERVLAEIEAMHLQSRSG
ncbi:MAG: WYL domain-containing protein [Planctomycetes bacterium]|nr:WYL domain-containing protein [Planctomycetota bacterium]